MLGLLFRSLHPTFTLRLASLTAPFGRLTRIVSAPFQVRPLGVGPIRRVMDSPCLSAAGIRFSILPSPAGDLGLPHGRLTTGVCSGRPHRALHVPHEEDAVRGGCLLYAEVFGVLKPESTTNSGANATTHHRLNQDISMTFSSFDASTKIHFRSPVLPSPDPVCPPGSGFPLDFSGGFAQVVTDSARSGWRRDRTLSRVH